MPRPDAGDRLSADDHVPFGDEGLDRLIARDDAASVRDGQHPPIDDPASETHNAVRGREQHIGTCLNVDTAVAWLPRLRWTDKSIEDPVGCIDGPRPVARRGRGETENEQYCQD